MAPPLKVTLLEFWYLWRQKARVNELPYGVVSVILCLAVVVEQLRLVTDRQTDRRTDGRTDRRTHDDSTYRATIASRSKSYNWCWFQWFVCISDLRIIHLSRHIWLSKSLEVNINDHKVRKTAEIRRWSKMSAHWRCDWYEMLHALQQTVIHETLLMTQTCICIGDGRTEHLR